jgi:hypothetical protein
MNHNTEQLENQGLRFVNPVLTIFVNYAQKEGANTDKSYKQ